MKYCFCNISILLELQTLRLYSFQNAVGALLLRRVLWQFSSRLMISPPAAPGCGSDYACDLNPMFPNKIQTEDISNPIKIPCSPFKKASSALTYPHSLTASTPFNVKSCTVHSRRLFLIVFPSVPSWGAVPWLHSVFAFNCVIIIDNSSVRIKVIFCSSF